jgi:RND family efflux transporter MFP subunit
MAFPSGCRYSLADMKPKLLFINGMEVKTNLQKPWLAGGLMKKNILFFVAACGLLFFSCKGEERTGKSMAQIYADDGYPVQVRTIRPESFSVYLKYPAEFRAQNQSTAYAKTNDVVRIINFQIGDYVSKDDVVVGFSMDNSSYQQAKVAFENAQASYNRINTLYLEAGVSKQDFDNARTQYELAREAFRAASELVQAKAPIGGYITQLNVRPSANVRPGDALFTISSQNTYEAVFYVLPNEIDSIHTGAKVFIQGRHETIEGNITEVSLMMDPLKKAFPVKAAFDGKPRTLVSGMSVDVSVEVYRNDKALTVHMNELIRSSETWTVFTVEGGRAVQEKVDIGRNQGFQYEVTGGLVEGDLLVSEGNQELNNGVKVRIFELPLVSLVEGNNAYR